jgi:hypothetical protein
LSGCSWEISGLRRSFSLLYQCVGHVIPAGNLLRRNPLISFYNHHYINNRLLLITRLLMLLLELLQLIQYIYNLTTMTEISTLLC